MNQKSFYEIVNDLIVNIKDSMPNIDTKEGTFVRDVFINPQSDEIAGLYGQIRLVDMAQSVLTATKEDLDRLAKNYFLTRESATPAYGKIRFYITNTNYSVISDDDLPEEISIPINTEVVTGSNTRHDILYFKTMESVYLTRAQIKLLNIDTSNGFQYIEVAVSSSGNGSVYNIGSGEIINFASGEFSGISFVSNPYGFSGGTDQESDYSLGLRICLAITGNNIGTKDGYLSYTLKQNGVIDAVIVGAGDDLMFRDGGYIDTSGKYIAGEGGMVDVYVRGQIDSEEIYNFNVTSNYVLGEHPYADIILPHQPVNNIISIISKETGKVYINANDYETEKSSTLGADGKMSVSAKYYKDLLWDFSIKTSFPDASFFPLPSDMTPIQIEQLKRQVDNELIEAMSYMSNMTYSLNWALVYKKTTEGGSTPLFDKIFYNEQVFKIEAKDTRLNGRCFVKRNDKIYVRVYRVPDFTLSKDTTAIGRSVISKDKLKWLNNEKPIINDTLIITYNYDQLIYDIQYGMEQVRCLTADVLIKQAEKIPIEIFIEANCYSTADPNVVKKAIINNITTYVDNIQRMGGTFDRSDIVTIARQTDSVDSVNLNTIKISIAGQSPKERITALAKQYLKVENIICSVYSNNSVNI